MTDQHRIFQRQLKRSTDSQGNVDLIQLGQLVSTTYAEADQERRRGHRANLLMSAELNEASLAQQKLLDEMRKQNSHFEAALENMSQGLCFFDAEERLVVCNSRFRSIWSLTEAQAVQGATLSELIGFATLLFSGSAERERGTREYRKMAASRKHERFNVKLDDGRWIAMAHEPLPDGGFVQTFEDITARRLADAKIAHLATHDVLTDLPNRGLLQSQIETRLAQGSSGGQFALLSLDLDRFKPVNDSLGHPVGDSLLGGVANRLREQIRGTDFVSRVGGDEFAIVLGGCNAVHEAEQVAARIVSDLSRPFEIGGHKVVIGVSIGIAIAPTDGSDSVQLIKSADMALYSAKSEGRGRFKRFEAQMDQAAQVRRALEVDLRQALARNQFQMVYQPLMRLDTQVIEGFEALMRWKTPIRGDVPPSVFIPLAEEVGLIDELGRWALHSACQEAASWPAHIKVAVNVSPKQFQNATVLPSVIDALLQTGLPAHRLELEITESVLLENRQDTRGTLHRLRELGVSIAMDDFGTGYSSLAYLSTFPFDKIKIDRSFVSALGQRSDAIAIVRAVTGLCKSLGISSTAEGVETAAQLQILSEESCSQVQGFFFSKPVPAAELRKLIGQYSPVATSTADEPALADNALDSCSR